MHHPHELIIHLLPPLFVPTSNFDTAFAPNHDRDPLVQSTYCERGNGLCPSTFTFTHPQVIIKWVLSPRNASRPGSSRCPLTFYHITWRSFAISQTSHTSLSAFGPLNMAAPLINHPCTLCCKPTSMWCSRCQSAWYCTPEHLQSDWPRHRKECIPATQSSSGQTYNMIATPPPAEPQLITVSAILFSPEEERPRIIPVQCRPPLSPVNGMCPVPLLQDSFPGGGSESIVLAQGLNGEPLRFPLHVWYSGSCLQRGAPINRAIYHITQGRALKPWCGTVVVLKFNGSRRQGYSDAGSNDLPALSAYFLAYK